MACLAMTENWDTAMFWVAIVAVLIALITTMISFASERIRQWWNQTKISLVLDLPEKVTVPSFGCVYWLGKTPPNRDDIKDAIWVRMRVSNKGRLSARSCQAFLTTIKKKNNDGKYKAIHRDMLQLHWAFKDGEKEPAIDIPGGLEAYCDVFKTEEGVNNFSPRTVAQPVTWQLFSQPGEYKLEVVVAGDNVKTQYKYHIYIRWTSDWDNFGIRSDEKDPWIPVRSDGSSKRDNNVPSS